MLEPLLNKDEIFLLIESLPTFIELLWINAFEYRLNAYAFPRRNTGDIGSFFILNRNSMRSGVYVVSLRINIKHRSAYCCNLLIIVESFFER